MHKYVNVEGFMVIVLSWRRM